MKSFHGVGAQGSSLELILEPKPPNQVLHTDTEIFLFELSSESSAAFMGDAYGVDTETP